MHRLLNVAVACVSCILSACAPIRTTIENDTGSPIVVDVRSSGGQRLAFGNIPAATGLELQNPIAQVASVAYTYGGKSCRVSPPNFVITKSDSADSIHLRRC